MIKKSFEDPAFPIKEDFIRLKMYNAKLLWEEDDHAQIIEVATFNMGGYFPIRLMNMTWASMLRQNT